MASSDKNTTEKTQVNRPEKALSPGVLCGFRIVRGTRRILRGIIEHRKKPLPAAIGHVIDQHAMGSARVLRPQHEEIGLVFDEPPRVARRLVEIDDTGVFRRVRVQQAMREAADSDISPGLAELMAIGKCVGSSAIQTV